MTHRWTEGRVRGHGHLDQAKTNQEAAAPPCGTTLACLFLPYTQWKRTGVFRALLLEEVEGRGKGRRGEGRENGDEGEEEEARERREGRGRRGGRGGRRGRGGRERQEEREKEEEEIVQKTVTISYLPPWGCRTGVALQELPPRLGGDRVSMKT